MVPENNPALDWDKFPEFSETMYYAWCVLGDWDMDWQENLCERNGVSKPLREDYSS